MSSQSNTYGKIDVALRRASADGEKAPPPKPNPISVEVELRVTDPTSDGDIDPCLGSAHIPLEQLKGLGLRPVEYGQELTAQLFQDPALREFYRTSKAVFESRGMMIRLQLSIGPSVPELYSVRWELLCDPETKQPLAMSERILFSRFMFSRDWRKINLRPKAQLRAAIAVSAPNDVHSPEWGLAKVDKVGEIARARAALAGIEAFVIAEESALTLTKLIDAIRRETDVLYLVCHGGMPNDQPILYLQDEKGNTEAVIASEFAQRIGELELPPRLIVLASCESAGREDGGSTAQSALAPRLAEAGVPAVLAMQGKITMKTVEQAMPVFFRELAIDGQIDQAMAAARGAVRDRDDSWMPALFLRLKRGRIWEEEKGLNITPEQLQRLLQAAGSAQQAKVDDLSEQLNTNAEAVRGFLKILSANEVPLEKLPETLAEIARRHGEMLQRLEVLEPDTPETQAYIQQAHAMLSTAKGPQDYDRADQLLEQAEAADMRALREAETLQREAMEAVRRKRLSAAANRAERGELSLTRLEYLQAGQHFKAAAELVGIEEPALRVAYLDNYAYALYVYGSERGDNAVLAQAIEVLRSITREIRRGEMPLVWANTQNDLGAALTTFGKRESGTERLEEAVSAFREALQERTRERVPLQWALTQQNLGVALVAIGDRESGTARLKEAVVAYREALQERTRERVPLEWAATQQNLGVALAELGDREGGTARLEEAVIAYRDALQERARERVPLEWATTQNNLGTALTSVRRTGERDGAAGGSGDHVSRGPGGARPGAGAPGMGRDPEQPRYRTCRAKRAGERDGAAGGSGGRLSRRFAGVHPGAGAPGMGTDAGQPWPRACQVRRCAS